MRHSKNLSSSAPEITHPLQPSAPPLEDTDENENDIPDDFVCAISFELMDDPVMLPCGKICDRKSILDWFARESREYRSQQRLRNSKDQQKLRTPHTNPFTRKPLRRRDLKPLPDLKARIAQYREEIKPRLTPELKDRLEHTPELFIDPLTDMVMYDPIILPTGQRADKNTIRRWLTKQNTRGLETTCPYSRQPIKLNELPEDEYLRQIILDYSAKKRRLVKAFEESVDNAEQKIAEFENETSLNIQMYEQLNALKENLHLDINTIQHWRFWDKQTPHILSLSGEKQKKYGDTYYIPKGVYEMMTFISTLKNFDIHHVMEGLDKIRSERSHKHSFFRSRVTRELYDADSLIDVNLPALST